jgi:chondroitin AC lyase
MQKPKLPAATQIQKEGLTNFVGAVTDGLYGAVAFDFKSPHDMLEVKKSWFFFDKEYVCLGAGIKPKANLPVATTINQVLLKSEVHINQNGVKKLLSNGNRVIENVKWVHQDKVGYIFPNATTINLSNQSETGRWSDLTDQTNISKEQVSTDIFKLWFNHGDKINETDNHGQRKLKKSPGYEYIVVPNVSIEGLEGTIQNNRGIEILSNTEELQAVKHNILGQVQLAFYRAGEIEIGKGEKVKMESQGLALLKTKNGKVAELTLSDPSRNLNKILISLPGIYTLKGEGVLAIPNAKSKHTMFIIDLPQGVYAGKSVSIKL